jgi:GTP 3',8-cyclase
LDIQIQQQLQCFILFEPSCRTLILTCVSLDSLENNSNNLPSLRRYHPPATSFQHAPFPRVPSHLLPSLGALSSTSPLRTFSTSTSSHKSQPPNSKPNKPIPLPLPHLTSSSQAHIIPITSKHPTFRTATAICVLFFSDISTHDALTNAALKKGDALAVARIAGIQAAKKTADLIPLAHPGLGIEGVAVDVLPFHDAKCEGERVGETSNEEGGEGESHGLAQIPAQIRNEAPQGGVFVSATVSCTAKTGVEMEALTAATVAGLAMYDMCKSVDKGMRLGEARVVRKEGGKSGTWVWDWEKEEVVKS